MQAIWNFISSKPETRTVSEGLLVDGPVFEGGDHRRPLILVRSPRTRRMRLVVDPRDGAVKLTLPPRASTAEALKWAQTKRSWIEAQLSRLPRPTPITPGMSILVGGQQLTLDWDERRARTPKIAGNQLLMGGPEELLSARLLRWIKREALTLMTSETLEYAQKRAIKIGKIGVGDPVSRWGSCAVSGDIRYSWRLMLAPDFVRRATIAHEVAHRIHMNHGPEFHALVADLFESDPTPARRWLRANGAALHWFGRSG
jgi:predicted metal-dependent hydrolase